MIPDLHFFKAASLLSLFALFYFYSIQETPIYDETEGQYAGAVRVMEGYWEIPTNNGIPRLQKPPLTYWVMKLSSTLIKNQELAMRVPFVLALLGLLLTTYAIAVSIMDHDRAIAAMAILGVTFGLFIFGRMVMPEVLFSLFIALTFWGSMKALQSDNYGTRNGWWTFVWGMMALGSFTKGFHGLFWPLAVLGGARGLEIFQREAWSGFWKVRNLLLFLAITLPWYIAVEQKYPGFIQDNLWNEQFGHALDFRFPPTYSRVSLLSFLLQHLFLIFPSILFIPHALKTFELTRDQYSQRQFRKLLIMIPAVVFISTCFSARQDYYTMASWFAVALLVVVGFNQRSRSGWLLFPFGVFGLLGIGLIVIGLFWNKEKEGNFRSDTTDHFFSILTQLPVEIRPLLFISGGTFIVGALLGYWFWRSRFNSFIFIGFMVAMAGPLCGVSQGVKILSEAFSLKEIAQSINSRSDSLIIVDGVVSLASSLFYYTERQIHFVRANSETEFATRRFGIGSERYWGDEELVSRWNSEQNLLLVIHERDRDFWQERLGENFYEIADQKSGSRILISNHLP